MKPVLGSLVGVVTCLCGQPIRFRTHDALATKKCWNCSRTVQVQRRGIEFFGGVHDQGQIVDRPLVIEYFQRGHFANPSTPH